MAQKKSTVRDTIINIVLFALAGGLLVYRVRDCKRKEHEQAQHAAQQQQQETRKQVTREQRCLDSVKESERNGCVQCTCRWCADAFQACEQDERCRSMRPEAPAADAAPSPESSARRRFDARAACVVQHCYSDCLTAKQP
jgi:hypothetical protein